MRSLGKKPCRALEEQPFGWQIGHDGNAVLTDGDGAGQFNFVGQFCADILTGHDFGLRGEAPNLRRVGRGERLC